MSKQLAVDVVIIGGGIAGLWLNVRLHQLGYRTLLVEKNTLGGGQTVKSQGIIHGGTKYALHGSLTTASEAISGMPKRWRECVAGKGEIDLSGVKVLSQYHYLWSPGSLAGNLMSFFASKALRARVKQVKGAELPEALRNPQFKGKAYQLDELVFDVESVVERLAALSEHTLLLASQIKPVESADNEFVHLEADGFAIQAKRVIFSAGEGNEGLIGHFNLTKPKSQTRPLHMVLVKSPHIKPLYAHCLGSGVKPRVTVTTHYHQDGTPVWYLGGELAEASGVARSEHEQVEFAKSELSQLVPWIDLSEATWASLRVNRAEPAQSNLTRPDSAFIVSQQAISVGWPTKLALAPDFADQCIELLMKQGITAGNVSWDVSGLPVPTVATGVWNQLL